MYCFELKHVVFFHMKRIFFLSLHTSLDFFQRGVNELHVSLFESEVFFYKEKEKKRKVDVT